LLGDAREDRSGRDSIPWAFCLTDRLLDDRGKQRPM
jgi:hypothetical protein